MTTANPTPLDFRLAGPHRPRRRWWRAIRALRELLAHPERTHLVFEMIRALEPDERERALQRLLAQPEGRRLFSARRSLGAALLDRSALEGLPAGSFGRVYLDHMDRYGLDPAELVQLGRRTRADATVDDDLRWMSDRGALTHDLWHVLTNYGADPIGEAKLLWFSLAQLGGRVNLLLAVGTALRVTRVFGLRWLRDVFVAWRRGRRAIDLHAIPYEDLLALPIEEVRAALRIEPEASGTPR